MKSKQKLEICSELPITIDLLDLDIDDIVEQIVGEGFIKEPKKEKKSLSFLAATGRRVHISNDNKKLVGLRGKKGNLRSSWKSGSIFCIILLALSALPLGMSSMTKFLPRKRLV